MVWQQPLPVPSTSAPGTSTQPGSDAQPLTAPFAGGRPAAQVVGRLSPVGGGCGGAVTGGVRKEEATALSSASQAALEQASEWQVVLDCHSHLSMAMLHGLWFSCL